MTDSSGCIAIPWSHWEWTEEWDREGEAAESVMKGVDEDEVEDCEDIEELGLG